MAWGLAQTSLTFSIVVGLHGPKKVRGYLIAKLKNLGRSSLGFYLGSLHGEEGQQLRMQRSGREL